MSRVPNYVDFSKGKDLKDCFFRINKLLSGNYKFDRVLATPFEGFMSYEEFINFTLEDGKVILLNNKGTITPSQYRTTKGLINRINK